MSVTKSDDNNINSIINNNSLTEEQFDVLLNQTVNSDIFQISSLQFNLSTDRSRDFELYEQPEASIEKIKQELNDMNFFEESNENSFLEEEEYNKNSQDDNDNIDFNLDLINNKILESDSTKNSNNLQVGVIDTATNLKENSTIINNKNNISLETNITKISNNNSFNTNYSTHNSININSNTTSNNQLNLDVDKRNTSLDDMEKSMDSYIHKVSTTEFLKSELNSNNVSFQDIKIGNKKSLIEIFRENKSVESSHNKLNHSFNLSLNNSLSNKRKSAFDSSNLLSKSTDKNFIENSKVDNSITQENSDLNLKTISHSHKDDEKLNNNDSVSSIILSTSKQNKSQNSSYLLNNKEEQKILREDLNTSNISNSQNLSKPPLPLNSQSFIIESNLKNNGISNSLINFDKATSNNSILSNILNKSQSSNKSFLNDDFNSNVLNKSQSSNKSFVNNILEDNHQSVMNKSQSSNKSFINGNIEDINKSILNKSQSSNKSIINDNFEDLNKNILNKSQLSNKSMINDNFEDFNKNILNKSQSSNKSIINSNIEDIGKNILNKSHTSNKSILNNILDISSINGVKQDSFKKESAATLFDAQKESLNNLDMIYNGDNMQEPIQVNRNEVSFDRRSIYEYISTMNKENNTSMTDNSIYNYIFNIKNDKNNNQVDINDKLDINYLNVDSNVQKDLPNQNNISIINKSFNSQTSKNENNLSQINSHLNNSFVNNVKQNNNNSASIYSAKEFSNSVNGKTKNELNESNMDNSLIQSKNSPVKTSQLNNSMHRNSIQGTDNLSSSVIKYIEGIKSKYNDLPSEKVNKMVLKELTEECQHLKNLNEVQLKLNKELETKLELKNKENKNEINQLKEKYEAMINNIQEVDNKKTGVLQNQIKVLENQLIETNESQAQIAAMQRDFQKQQEIDILNIKSDLSKKYEQQLQEVLQDKDTFIKKLESENHLKQAELYKEKSLLQEELKKLKSENQIKQEELYKERSQLEKELKKIEYENKLKQTELYKERSQLEEELKKVEYENQLKQTELYKERSQLEEELKKLEYENQLKQAELFKETSHLQEELKKLESENQLKQAELEKERTHLQEELVKMKEEIEKKNEQILDLTVKAEKPSTKEFSQQFDKGLEEKQDIIDNYKAEMDAVRQLLYTNIFFIDDYNRGKESPGNDLEYPSNSKSHEKYLKSLSLKQLVQTYIQQVNRNNEQMSKLKIIDRNKNDYVNEMEKQIKNLEITQKQILMENQNSIAYVENKYINEMNEQKRRYENDMIELKNKYEEVLDELQQKSEQMKEMANKRTFPESTLSELLEIYPNEFEEFKNEIESVVWKKLDEAWHARFKEDLTTASSRITQHCSEAYASAIAKLKTQSIAFKNKLENEFEKKFKKYVEERNKETNHLKHKYEQNQKQIEELKKQLNESKKTVKSLAQITYQHSQTEEKYHQALLDMKALYKSRLKKMYEDISKKKKEWIDQKIEIEREWENKYKTLKSEYYDKLRKAENELKIIKSQMPMKQRSFTDINEVDSHPGKESLNGIYTESEYYSNPEDESYITTNHHHNKYYSNN